MWLSKFYLWFWYHTEFWWTPTNRRPYTYVMRDWIFPHTGLFAGIATAWFAGMGILSNWHGTLSTVLTLFSALLTAHLVWGSSWIRNQHDPARIEEMEGK